MTVIDQQWYFLTKRSRCGMGWYAFAKREPFVADGHIVLEPGELYFSKYYPTEQDALAAIKREVFQ